MIRVVVADGHPVVREGVKQIASAEPFLSIVGEAGSADDLLELLASHDPDVLLLELALPGSDLVSLLELVEEVNGGAEVLILSEDERPDLARRCLRLGARGLVSMKAAPSELVDAIDAVSRGEDFLPPSLVAQLTRNGGSPLPHQRLTRREFQVLQMSAAGMRPSEIAEELSVTPQTVSTHRRRVLDKLGMRSFPEAIRYAVEHRLVERTA